MDDDELEYNDVLVGDCDGDCEYENDLECVMGPDPESRLCDRYSEGRGKYVCGEDPKDEVQSLPTEYLLL